MSKKILHSLVQIIIYKKFAIFYQWEQKWQCNWSIMHLFGVCTSSFVVSLQYFAYFFFLGTICQEDISALLRFVPSSIISAQFTLCRLCIFGHPCKTYCCFKFFFLWQFCLPLNATICIADFFCVTCFLLLFRTTWKTMILRNHNTALWYDNHVKLFIYYYLTRNILTSRNDRPR